jgi:prevent-host-death family protein
MVKRYSVAEARRNLPTVIEEALAGTEVSLTRRGQAVAVVISIAQYEQLQGRRQEFAKAYEAFRSRFPEGAGGIDPEYFDSLRERGAGRKVKL